MSEYNKEYIDELITAFLSKGATPEEQEKLLTWIESDVCHQEYYRQMYQTWMSSAQMDYRVPEREENALQNIRKKLFDISIVERRIHSGKFRDKIFLWKILRYAAAIVILMVITNMITWHFTKQQVPQASEMIYEASYGSRAFAILPDSSKVWLNSGSKLSVRPEFNHHERLVVLTGEAYFDVTTNPEKPFIVKAGELSIKATGTAFNVKAYPEEKNITTTLVEGIVFIEGVDSHEKQFALKMTPNQSVSYPRKVIAGIHSNDVTVSGTGQKANQPVPVVARQVKPEAFTSWMSDRWIIDNEDFGSLAIKLERRYNVEIRFKSEELKEYRFTGIIERETLEQMFDAFRYTIPLQYTINKGVMVLTTDVELKKQFEKAWIHQ